MKKFIITGATGFVGSNLLQYLKKELINDLAEINLRNSNWKSNIDLNAQAIIHLAGKAHDVNICANSEEYFEVNTNLTKELFDVFLESHCRDFIYFSSVKAVADKTNCFITEETGTNPQTIYGKSKLLAEQYIFSKPLPQGKRVFVIRPSMIHGPGNKGNLNLLYQLVAKGLPWPLGSFENQRSFCSIDNVCFVVNEILENENIPSGIYNLADDKALSTNELIQLIAKTTNKKTCILNIPKKLIKALARMGDVFQLPLNSERLDKLTENFVVSNEKIKNALQIEKFPVSAEEGLVKTVQYFNK